MNNIECEFLGLDLAMNNTGLFSVISVDENEQKFMEVFSPPKVFSDEQKMFALRHWLLTMLCVLKPKVIALERIGGFIGYGIASAYALGVLKEVVGSLPFDIDLRYISASSLKKFATGNGRSPKVEMREAAKSELRIKKINEHIADAFWMYQYILEAEQE